MISLDLPLNSIQHFHWDTLIWTRRYKVLCSKYLTHAINPVLNEYIYNMPSFNFHFHFFLFLFSSWTQTVTWKRCFMISVICLILHSLEENLVNKWVQKQIISLSFLDVFNSKVFNGRLFYLSMQQGSCNISCFTHHINQKVLSSELSLNTVRHTENMT